MEKKLTFLMETEGLFMRDMTNKLRILKRVLFSGGNGSDLSMMALGSKPKVWTVRKAVKNTAK